MEPSILIAEDHEGFRNALGYLLRDEGYRVIEARDGADALRRLEDGRFDLVLSNLKMPRADGYAVLRYAKNNYPNLPVILISGYGDEQTRKEALSRGADDYVFKPVGLDDLLGKIKRACQ
ncbi:MAG TPA: response regulator [Candidatus Acidoferrales bacterium]|nr:response regulator [Candidatus Acidoferrales bacterium]